VADFARSAYRFGRGLQLMLRCKREIFANLCVFAPLREIRFSLHKASFRAKTPSKRQVRNILTSIKVEPRPPFSKAQAKELLSNSLVLYKFYSHQTDEHVSNQD
jgi:hypothetical protein